MNIMMTVPYEYYVQEKGDDYLLLIVDCSWNSLKDSSDGR